MKAKYTCHTNLQLISCRKIRRHYNTMLCNPLDSVCQDLDQQACLADQTMGKGSETNRYLVKQASNQHPQTRCRSELFYETIRMH